MLSDDIVRGGITELGARLTELQEDLGAFPPGQEAPEQLKITYVALVDAAAQVLPEHPEVQKYRGAGIQGAGGSVSSMRANVSGLLRAIITAG